MNNPLSGQHGFMSVYVILLVVLLFTLGTAALTLTAVDRHISQRYRDQRQAYYMAEAGIERVLAHPQFLNSLDIDHDGNDDYPRAATFKTDEFLAGGYFTVKALRKGDCEFNLYSTGKFNDSTCVLSAQVLIPMTFGEGIHHLNSLCPECTGPNIDHFKQWFLDNADWTYAGDQTLILSEPATQGGIHYIDGDVNLSGIYDSGGIIACSGVVNIQGDVLRSGSESLIIVSLSGIIIGGEMDCTVEGLLLSTSDIVILNNSLLRGAVIANNLLMLDNGAFIYDGEMVSRRLPGTTGPVIFKDIREKYSNF